MNDRKRNVKGGIVQDMGPKKTKGIKFVKSKKVKEGDKGIESACKTVRGESLKEESDMIVENEGLLLQSEVNMETGKGLVNIYRFQIMPDRQLENTLLHSSGEPSFEMPEVSLEELLKFHPGMAFKDITEIKVKPMVMGNYFVYATAIF